MVTPGERMRYARVLLILLLSVTLVCLPAAHAAPAGVPRAVAAPTGVLLVTFDVQVDAGAADYVQRAAGVAIANQYDLLLVMNTPGGLLDSMQAIVSSLGRVQAAGLRVITFVPPNSMAASAGSYIALGSNAIYMGGGSFIGPSTPEVIGGTPDEQAHVQGAMYAYIQALAQDHGFNATAAGNMVLYNQAYTTSDAADIGLITGREDTQDGVLSAEGLSGLPVVRYDEPVYDQFLTFLSNPLVDGLFILVGAVALVLDIFHRTLFLSVVAVVLIALGFLGAQLIGAPLVAILVLIVAAALIFIEVKAGHGLFAAAGILLGLAGTYLLVYGVEWSPTPFGLGQYVVMGVVAGLLVVGFIYLARIRRALMAEPKLVDPTLIVGKTGRAMTDILPGKDGVANVSAEDWTATADEPIEKGSLVRVKSYSDGRVHLERAPPAGKSDKTG